MRRALLFLPLLCSSLSAAEDPFAALVRPTDPLTAAEEQTKLKVPDGFKVQLFASEPMINKPINLAFDEKGRLWVTSNTEYPFPAAKERWEDPTGTRVKDSRDAIKILEDTNGDGAADKVTDFADGLNVPIGVLPYGQGCIAWSIPNIWYFADTDGDGKCDKRTILFGPLGYENDTHGNIASLRLAPDGWVYATHGFANKSHFEVLPENLHGRKVGDPGTTLDLQSGSVFRFKPDGSAVEIWSRGQVNPFGMCWDSWGNIYTADCHSNPLTQNIRGAYYPSFGKPDDGLGFGPVLCPHDHNSTGLCAVVLLERGRWGEAYDEHILVGNVVTSRINQDFLKFTGATPLAIEQPDFLVSEDPWFRPVDMQLGPDHALYVADFYNKIIGHYEVDRKHPGRDRERGRIWKIVKEGAKTPAELTAEQKEAAAYRWTERGVGWATIGDISTAIKSAKFRRIIFEYVIGHPRADLGGIIASALKNIDPLDVSLRHTMRIAMRNCLALPNALQAVTLNAADEAAGTLSEIASVIGGIDTPEASEWQLAYLMKHPPDREALVASLAGIARRLPEARQKDLAELVQKQFPEDDTVQLDLLQRLLSGLGQRGVGPTPEVVKWGEGLAGRLLKGLQGAATGGWTGDIGTFGMEERNDSEGKSIHVLSSLPPGEGKTGTLSTPIFASPAKLTFWLCGHNGMPEQPDGKKNFVRLVQAATGAELQRAYPARTDIAQRISWDLSAQAGQPVRLEITDGDSGSAYAWLALGRLSPEVAPIALPSATSQWQPLAELTAALKISALAGPLAEAFARPDLNDPARNAIAQALQQFPDQKTLLVNLFKTVPSRHQRVLAQSLASTKEGAHQLIELAPARLLTEPALAQKLTALNEPALAEKIAAKTKDLPPLGAEVDALLAKRLKGFQAAQVAGTVKAEAGKQVFVTNCAICHQIAGEGKIVGPQLEGAKNRGAERLCEDILDPNRAVDPVFHLHIVKMKDATVIAGLQRREEGATLVFADAAGQEYSVEKGQISENSETHLSLMPAVFGESIPEADFYNLLAYLLEH